MLSPAVSQLCPWLSQEGVKILLVVSCYRNRDELQPDWPLGSHADFTFLKGCQSSAIIGFIVTVIQHGRQGLWISREWLQTACKAKLFLILKNLSIFPLTHSIETDNFSGCYLKRFVQVNNIISNIEFSCLKTNNSPSGNFTYHALYSKDKAIK